MLRTALKPSSLALLAVCLILSTAFVLLSRWQLESSQQARTVFDPAKEVVQPLTEIQQPGQPATQTTADQAVSATGTYLPGSTVLIADRLQGDRTGWWVVSGLRIPGTRGDWPDADQDAVVPVVRGWTQDPGIVPQVPDRPVSVVGRLLPPEAPVSTQGRGPRELGTLSPAQLTNLWDAPVHSAFVTADAEAPASRAGELTDAQGRLPQDGQVMGQGLEPVRVDQQPTDTGVDWLNLFYAVEWIVFALFALWLWWRTVRDDHLRRTDPAAWYDLDGSTAEYFYDQDSGRYYYYDPVAREYYFFDDQPAQHGAPAPPARSQQSEAQA